MFLWLLTCPFCPLDISVTSCRLLVCFADYNLQIMVIREGHIYVLFFQKASSLNTMCQIVIKSKVFALHPQSQHPIKYLKEASSYITTIIYNK